MFKKPQSIKAIYLYLILGNTLATSFIWGINTIFLLNAGLSNFQAFLANSFFTLGQVIFEIPTGVVADGYGRRLSYLLGASTLAVSTLLYFFMWHIRGPFWGWALSSILLGLGFTFFSGATEAWLVDALQSTNSKDSLESVLAKGQVVGGGAMLVGSVLGGFIAQATNLGVPYILRAVILLLNFATAFIFMKDIGFHPQRTNHPLKDMKTILNNSIRYGLKNAPVRWLMIASSFTTGVSFYIFYALQPFLLTLYGDKKAYAIAGLVAAVAALAQMAGGFSAPQVKRFFSKRTSALILGTISSVFILLFVAMTNNFWIALILIFLWGLIFAAIMPIRQAYMNGEIPSQQRATVLSFDSLMGSSGGIFIQPILGKVADASSYATSYFAASFFQLVALPFIFLAKKEKAPSDTVR